MKKKKQQPLLETLKRIGGKINEDWSEGVVNEASPHQSFDMKNVERLYKENDRWLQKNGLAWIRNNPHMADNLYSTANWFDKISKMMLKHYARINRELSKE